MKRLKKVILVLLFVFILTSCKKTSEYVFELEATNDSSYKWVYVIEDDSIIKVVDEDYDDESSNSLGRKYEYKVESNKKGTTFIHLNYIRGNDEEDVLYDYSMELKVNDDMEIEKISESGSYLSLMKFLSIDKDKLRLEKEFSEYLILFNDNVVNVGDDECAWLVVYDKNNEIVNSYAISSTSDNVYINTGEERVLIN